MSTEPGAGARVTLAVATYRRPELLRDLLPHLVREAGTLVPPADVVVVDNDPDGGAQVVALDTGSVRYVHEPRPGIAAARNAALDAATDAVTGDGHDARAHAIVFLDDDETPQPGWLSALVDCWGATGSDAVAGPVLSEVGPEADAWVRASGAFDRRRRATGSALPSAATNNLLLDLSALRDRGLRFDDRFGLTGGSDTLLTRQLVARSGRIVWCDEALVTESVPASRATRAWVLRRKRRSGNVAGRVALELARGPRARLVTRLELTARGTLRILRGAAVSRLARARGDVRRRATYECDVASGVGLLLAVYGHRVTEYLRES